jgi:chaperone BCS1
MPIIAVRFNYGASNNSKIFSQPLFYIAENIKQEIHKINETVVNESVVNESVVIESVVIESVVIESVKEQNLCRDDNLEFDNLDKNIIKLEMCETNGWTDVQIIYKLNKYDNNIKFTYKKKQFDLKIINVFSNTTNTLIKDNIEDYTLYTAYEIIYDSLDIKIFEDFIKTSIIYYEKYYCINNEKLKDSISIYITSQEGFYFTHLGKRNKRNIESVYLPKKQKQDIINDLEKFLNIETKKKYNRLGINYKRIYLLEGLPGTGKTSLITGLASKFNFNIAIVSFIPKMTDVDLIKSLRTLRDYDEKDTNTKKTFLIFEDIDCIFKERKTNDESRNSITFSGLLNALDGITTNDIICFITTNYKCNLDSALLRPGRIDYIMKFDYAIKEQILDIFKDFTSETNSDIIQSFYNECCKLNIKITTALLQQYLMKYIDNPKDAIDNINEMKDMFSSANVSKEAEESGLYS